MAEEKKEPWLNYLALTTVILAVCATLSTFKGGGFSTRSVLSQTQASDQWAYYQAKSIREHLYRSQATLLENELGALSEILSPQSAEKIRSSIKSLGDRAEQYSNEKKEINRKPGSLKRNGT